MMFYNLDDLARTATELHGALRAAEPARVLRRRVDQLAEELGMDRARLRGWALAQAVLAACFCLEDHGHGWEPFLACAEWLAEIER